MRVRQGGPAWTATAHGTVFAAGLLSGWLLWPGGVPAAWASAVIEATPVTVAGEEEASRAVRPQGGGMTMVTFNLHHDREEWMERRRTILAELQHLQPDAIALQEVIEKPGVRNQAEWLAKGLGYQYLFVSTDPPGASKRYGNAVLTRRPVLARNEHLLQPLDDYRTVGHLRIEVGGQPVNVYATHFNERSDEHGQRIRRMQVEDLLRFIAATSAGAPVVIAGDFNALVDAGDLSALRSRYGDSYGSVHVNNDLSTVSTLNRHYYQAPSRIDHIFFQQDEMLAREARLLFDEPDGDGRWASDHYGVWTRLQFAPQKQTGAVNSN